MFWQRHPSVFIEFWIFCGRGIVLIFEFSATPKELWKW